MTDTPLAQRNIQFILLLGVATLLGGSFLNHGSLTVSVLTILVSLFLPGFAIYQWLVARHTASHHCLTDVAVGSFVLSLGWLLGTSLLVTALGWNPTPSIPLLTSLLLAGGAMTSRPIHATTLFSKQEQYVLSALLTAIALVLVIPHMLSSTVTLSFHGSFHSAIVNDILRTGYPPMNPLYAGEPLRTYWPFHLLLGTLSATAVIHPLYVGLILNVIAAVGTVGLVAAVTSTLLGESRLDISAVVAAGSTIFGLNAILALPILQHSSLSKLLQTTLPYRLYVYTPLEGYDSRIITYLGKFLNQGGFPTGLLLFACLLYLFVRLRRTATPRSRLLFGLGAVLLIHIHTTTALLVLPAFAITSLAMSVTLSTRSVHRPRFIAWTGVWGGTALLSTPFLMHLVSIPTNESISLTIDIGALFTIEYGFLLTLPLALYGWQQIRTDNGIDVPLGTLTAGMVLFPVFVKLPGGNGYKMLYLLSLPLGVLTAVGVEFLRRARPVSTNALLVVLLLIAIVNPVVFFTHSNPTSAEWLSNEPISLSQSQTTLATNENASAAFAWIASQTPSDAALIVDPHLENNAISDLGTPIWKVQTTVATLTNRNLFFTDMYPAYTAYPNAETRKEVTRSLLNCSQPNALPNTSVDGPVYALILDVPAENLELSCNRATVFKQSPHWEQTHRSGQFIVFKQAPGG